MTYRVEHALRGHHHKSVPVFPIPSPPSIIYGLSSPLQTTHTRGQPLTVSLVTIAKKGNKVGMAYNYSCQLN